MLSILESRSAACGLLFLRRSSVLVGSTVAASGSVGYVGLIVPHLVRLAVGSDNRLVIPFSALVGRDVCRACGHRCTHGDIAEGTAGRSDHGVDRRTVVYLSFAEELAEKKNWPRMYTNNADQKTILIDPFVPPSSAANKKC